MNALSFSFKCDSEKKYPNGYTQKVYVDSGSAAGRITHFFPYLKNSLQM